MSSPAASDASRKRATRTDVARLAGVSTATVSYALNGNTDKVSHETAQRVLAAAEKLNYRPSSIARALKTGMTRMLGIVVPDIANPYFGELIKQLESTATAHGYSLMVNLSHGIASIERERVNELFDRGVEAIFLSPAQSDAELGSLATQGKHLVGLDHTTPTPGMKCVSTDFQNAAYAVTSHLLNHGKRHAIMLFGDAPALSDPRVQGWTQAHQDHGLPVGIVKQSSFTREGAYQVTTELLRQPESERPDAIFAASDLEAIGAMRAIYESGLRIPEDIAIVSFDGTSETLYTQPQLTTMRQNVAEIAQYAIKAALHPSQVPDVQLVHADFIIRQSCGCPSHHNPPDSH